jgi:mannose-6-phosphate isomerase-like protein (cupin superfamily)
MDLFKLGLRSVLGITLPGAMLVLIFCYAAFSILFALDQPVQGLLWGKEQQFLAFAILFLLSYNIGGLLRLNSADAVDRKSSRILTREFWKTPQYSLADPALLEATRDKILENKASEISTAFDAWIWRQETFPYSAWQFRKFHIYHPEEVLRFFQTYQSSMRGSEGRGKEFFNYCKMVIYKEGRAGDPLVDEVHFAEATVRFYAGTHAGLGLSSGALLTALLVQAFLWAPSTPLPKDLSLVATAALLGVVLLMKRAIVHRFRTLRLKEVDTVYDAFYLIHRHAENCGQCSPSAGVRAPLYAARSELLKAALGPGGSLRLDRLLASMKERGSADRRLASLYFAGAEVDHSYFLENDRIAVGLSVLPQDAEKAALCKRHPHQKEVLFVLEGALRLEVDEGGERRSFLMREGDVHEIREGQCHRVLPAEGQPGAFLFVKTRPVKEPRAEACELPDQGR